MKTLLCIAGTRPELIKLAPVIRRIRTDAPSMAVRTCFSGQHVEILESVLPDFGVRPDVDLRDRSVPRSLTQSLAWLLGELERAVADIAPDGVIVQGDTTTALAGALAAFYRGIPVFHVEAGLRTADPALPFPEEMNRRLITRLAALHFAPTRRALHNLVAEGVPADAIRVTGNTGIDALQLFLDAPSDEAREILARLRPQSRPILVTLHRRENFAHVASIARGVRHLVMAHEGVEVLWILHRNATRESVLGQFHNHPSVHLLEPLGYHTFVHVMRGAHMLLTDSGGIQEEAPALGKPVFVLRTDTERPEAVEAGCARVIGPSGDAIAAECGRLLDDADAYADMARPASPFGDGRASARIVGELEAHFGLTRRTRSGTHYPAV